MKTREQLEIEKAAIEKFKRVYRKQVGVEFPLLPPSPSKEYKLFNTDLDTSMYRSIED